MKKQTPYLYFFVEKLVKDRWYSCDTWEEDPYYLGCFQVPEKFSFYKEQNPIFIDLLTGINSDIGPLKPLAGLPGWPSTPIKLIIEYEKMRGGGFSRYHTYYSVSELTHLFETKKYSRPLSDIIKKASGNFCKDVLPKLKKIKMQKEVSDVRVIVWFDS